MDWRETFKNRFGDTFRLCCDDKTLQGGVESFIENLLEQEKKRMSDDVKKLYSLDYMKGSPASYINRALDKVLQIIKH